MEEQKLKTQFPTTEWWPHCHLYYYGTKLIWLTILQTSKESSFKLLVDDYTSYYIMFPMHDFQSQVSIIS